jgi:phosphatidylglycerol:prolipoprotein diacylglycerol transferase
MIGQWLVIAALIIAGPQVGDYLRKHGSAPFRDGLPIFGYGFMLFIAVALGGWWAARRAQREKLPSEKIWDLAFCLFLSGIAGARLFYLIQYRDRVFKDVTTIPEFVTAVLNLSNGGIVLYGGLIAAAVGFFVFCGVNRIRPLALLDIITPSIFLGIGFGRIGCFLNGCCYGDETTLPWGVQFPRDSATFGALVEKKLLDESAACTMPLHPTQIYSAIDGFILATLTAWYFSRRRRNGEVFAIGLTIYPITRFLIEFIRGDEPGLFGTPFTISQWISAVMFTIAMGYMVCLSRRPAVREPICTEPLAGSGGGVSTVARPQAAAH